MPDSVRNRYSAALCVLRVFPTLEAQIDSNALERARLARPYHIALDGAVVQRIGNRRRCLSKWQREQQQQKQSHENSPDIMRPLTPQDEFPLACVARVLSRI